MGGVSGRAENLGSCGEQKGGRRTCGGKALGSGVMSVFEEGL